MLHNKIIPAHDGAEIGAKGEMRYRDIKTIDQQIAEHQKAMDKYRDPPDEFDDLLVSIECRYCPYETQQSIRWFRDGDDFTGTLRYCFSCGRKRNRPDDDIVKRLIEDFKEQGPQALKLRL